MALGRRRLTVLILLLLVGQVALAAAGIATAWSSKLPTPPPIADDVVLGSPDQPATLESAYVVAHARALEWSARSVLLTASIQFDWPLDAVVPGPPVVPGGGWVTFAFYSPDVDGQPAVLSLLVERYFHAIRLEQVAPWPRGESDWSGLPLESAAVDSVLALVTAEIGLGQAYRQECPEFRHQTRLTLDRVSAREGGEEPLAAAHLGTPAQTALVSGTPIATGVAIGTPTLTEQPTLTGASLMWTVSYQDRRQPDRLSLNVRIDAMTGDVIEIRDQRVAC